MSEFFKSQSAVEKLRRSRLAAATAAGALALSGAATARNTAEAGSPKKPESTEELVFITAKTFRDITQLAERMAHHHNPNVLLTEKTFNSQIYDSLEMVVKDKSLPGYLRLRELVPHGDTKGFVLAATLEIGLPSLSPTPKKPAKEVFVLNTYSTPETPRVGFELVKKKRDIHNHLVTVGPPAEMRTEQVSPAEFNSLKTEYQIVLHDMAGIVDGIAAHSSTAGNKA